MRLSPQPAQAITKSTGFPGTGASLQQRLLGVRGTKEAFPLALEPREESLCVKILRPLGVERMSLSIDLDMSDDLGIRSFDQYRPIFGCGEDPISCSALLEGCFLNPALPLLTVSFSKPGPQLRVDDMIDFGEGCRGRPMPVVVRPAADDRIERLNQPFLRFGPGSLFCHALDLEQRSGKPLYKPQLSGAT